MSSIPNSEPTHADAHSPISDEEIEAHIDSDNTSTIQHCFLVKLDKTIHQNMGIIQEFLGILFVLLISNGFLYNNFSKD